MDKQEMQKKLRELGWSQAELARIGETYPSTICRWKKVPGFAKAFINQSLALKRILEGEK
jgi:hypothetical protein